MPAVTEVRTLGLAGRWQFDAMNTRVSVFTRSWHGLEPLLRAERLFHEMEARLSRFLPASELSLLNACAGLPVQASPQLFRILELCRHFHERTGGLFEPAVLAILESAGYDCSFEQVDAHAPDTPVLASPCGSITDVQLDRKRLAVTVPPGLRLDLGGIGKGYTVDFVARELQKTGDLLIDAGGDILARGGGEDGRGWFVAVGDPHNPARHISRLWLRDQALATSAVVRRRWRRGERWLHHLIDPRTAAPVENGVLAVSVVAPSATEADVLAKTALLLGPDEGGPLLERNDASGLFVLPDDVYVPTKNWPGGME